jgi:H+-transporting ATPase
MAIAYDNTLVSTQPIRWEMPRVLGISAVLGFFAVVQSFGLLLMGTEVINHPAHSAWFGLSSMEQLQSMMFLQLVASGPLLLFVIRCERWFFLPPYPAAPLFGAIAFTQLVALLMCGFGWLVEPITWTLITAVWIYNIAWMFVMAVVRLVTERFVDHRTVRHTRSMDIVNQALHPQALATS